MARSLQEQYYPAPVPRDTKDLPRYLETEFYRIRERLIAQPVSTTLQETGDFPTTTTVSWTQTFIGVTPTWDIPGGAWDPATGIYTVPQEGLYSVNQQLEVSPFGLGNKNYYAGLAFIRDRDGTITRFEATDGGVDNIPLGVTQMGMLYLLQGDKLTMEMTVVHEQTSGTAPYKLGFQILRVSA